MSRFEVETKIDASREVCFDLARSIDFHQVSFAVSGERAVAGRMEGLIELGEEVTWEAKHFGVVHRHTSRITVFDRPCRFRDSMVSGRFLMFYHDHFFEELDDGRTLMRDVVEFRSPLGVLGWLVDALFLRRYLQRIISLHGEHIKVEAESV